MTTLRAQRAPDWRYVSVFYYALAWWARPEVPEDAATFTFHKQSGFGDLLLCVGLASPLEIVPVHVILHRWSSAAAWIATILGIYGAFWCVAVARSLNLLPCYATAEEIVIRFGLLFTLRIPRGSLASIGDTGRPGIRTIPRNATPDIFLEFDKPLRAEGMLGGGRPIAAIALAADRPDELMRALRS